MTNSERHELLGRLHGITTTLTVSVAIGLGQWAGLGCWTSLPADFRTRAGTRALDEMRTALTELTEVRDRLATLLGAQADPHSGEPRDA